MSSQNLGVPGSQRNEKLLTRATWNPKWPELKVFGTIWATRGEFSESLVIASVVAAVVVVVAVAVVMVVVVVAAVVVAVAAPWSPGKNEKLLTRATSRAPSGPS